MYIILAIDQLSSYCPSLRKRLSESRGSCANKSLQIQDADSGYTNSLLARKNLGESYYAPAQNVLWWRCTLSAGPWKLLRCIAIENRRMIRNDLCAAYSMIMRGVFAMIAGYLRCWRAPKASVISKIFIWESRVLFQSFKTSHVAWT